MHCKRFGHEKKRLGRCVYEQDPDLGPVLRINTPQLGAFQLAFAENPGMAKSRLAMIAAASF